ncbi:hypothetical protein [Nocardioides caldifontis]|uniref:hypothetical protein n=1 Tax=Nocardioides caldifontis TaxID=2588938 RepID=UPI0011DFF764|nr:hypothetical protein [Nocardioides caldifontis]
MRRTSTLLALPAALAGLAGVALVTVPADASAARARTTVTIRADGVELSGTVSSPRPAKCAKGRLVVVFQQKGVRGGGDDVRVASDVTERDDGRYEWETGNTGLEGRFYAKVRRTPHCKADTSPTVRAVR